MSAASEPRFPFSVPSLSYFGRDVLFRGGDGAIAGFRRWATQFYGAAS